MNEETLPNFRDGLLLVNSSPSDYKSFGVLGIKPHVKVADVGGGKFGAKILSHYTDIVICMLGYFNLNHPVHCKRDCSK